MTKHERTVKKCGVLRGVCGIYFLETPQDNTKSHIRLNGLRYVAGFVLYPLYTRARAHARARMCNGVTADYTPQYPANSCKRLNDNALRCGVWGFGNPAKTPQITLETPQMPGRPS